MATRLYRALQRHGLEGDLPPEHPNYQKEYRVMKAPIVPSEKQTIPVISVAPPTEDAPQVEVQAEKKRWWERSGVRVAVVTVVMKLVDWESGVSFATWWHENKVEMVTVLLAAAGFTAAASYTPKKK